MPDDKKPQSKTIVFLHPDLGIGGAERLVVDAAVGLQKRGHKVVIFTSHCDPAHCFDEARDGTLDVRVRGNTLVPPTLLGRFSILCAILRQAHLILQIALFTSELARLSSDAFFVDQLSAGLPLLKALCPSAPIFFYCHFPDLLLVQGRARPWKRLYRIPFDWLEQWSMGYADAIAVNSAFTKSIVSRTWPRLAQKRDLQVVYPCIDTTTTSSSSATASKTDNQQTATDNAQPLPTQPLPWKNHGLLLSINRFERKKNIALALHTFALLPQTPKTRRAKLVLAGGYDHRVAENVAYHTELCALADSLGLKHATAKTLVSALKLMRDDDDNDDDDDDGKGDGIRVLFLLSVPTALKELLLASATLLLYTPRDEHFGIVPLEAMLRGVPVLAADSGGPRETVVDGVTGWLRDPGRPEEWTEVVRRVLEGEVGEEKLEAMGKAGRERVKEKFAEGQMAERLEGIFERMVDKRMMDSLAASDPRAMLASLVPVFLAGVVALGGLLAAVVMRRG